MRMELARGNETVQPLPFHERSPGRRPRGRLSREEKTKIAPTTTSRRPTPIRMRPRSDMALDPSSAIGEDLGSFPEQLFRGTRFGQQPYGPRKPVGASLDAGEVYVGSGEDEDPAGGHPFADLLDQGEAVPSRHRDIAEQEIGAKLPGAVKPVIGGIAGYSFKAIALKDDAECICNQSIIIYYQDPLLRRGHVFLS